MYTLPYALQLSGKCNASFEVDATPNDAGKGSRSLLGGAHLTPWRETFEFCIEKLAFLQTLFA